MKIELKMHLLLALALLSVQGIAHAQGTAFGYQGQLKEGGSPATGLYDFTFDVFDVETDGVAITLPVVLDAVPVTNGLFNVTLDFGPSVFTGPARWLEISVRAAGVGDPTILSPRTSLQPTPYAIFAGTAAGVTPGAVTADQLNSGGVPPAAGQFLAFDGAGLVWSDPGIAVGDVWSRSGLDAYYSAGNVGIGTSTPAAKLDVRGHMLLEAGTSPVLYTGTGGAELNRYLSLINTPTAPSASGLKAGGILVSDSYAYANPGKNDMVVKGNVGIGVRAPSAPLDIFAEWQSAALGVPNISLSGSYPTLRWVARSTFPEPLGLVDSWIAHVGGGNGLEFWYRNQDQSTFPFTDTGWQYRAQITTDGDINYVGRLGKLDTAEQFAATVRAADFFLGHSGRRGTPGRALVDGGSALFVNFASDWATTVIGGSVTEVRALRITGGADLAEPFAMSHRDVEPGSVVVIDPENPGKLRRSAAAYDKKVAGIVSGANGVRPGISMIQEDALQAGENVALSGRVYVKANTGAGAIEPGDLLTTSDVPGEAMKAADHARSQGAILGKAMTGLAKGGGMVLVLVTLQ